MKIFIKRFSIINLFLYSVCFLCLTSCSKKDPDLIVQGQAKIKVTNAVQTETRQNVYIDNEQLTPVSLAFGESSEYVKIPSGSRTLSYQGSNNINTNTSINFTPALTYSTFLVSDRNANREIVNYEDNLSISDMTISKIRLINLTPYFASGINVNIQTGAPFVNGLMYKEASNYFSLDAGATLRYNVVGSSIIKTIAATDLVPGKIYTIWFSGSTTATLEAHLVLDN